MNWWKTWKSQLKTKDWCANLLLYLIGVGLMPLGVVLTVNSHLGAGGYDALNFALGERMGINTSHAIYMTAFLAVILAAVIRKKMLRITTFISSFFLGLFTDMWKAILRNVEGNNTMESVVLLLIGVQVIAFAVAAYILCIFPSNPTDDLVAAMHEKGVRLGIAKIGLDVVCVIIAFLLGGEIGVGTIVCTLGLGPVIDWFYGWLQKLIQKCDIKVTVS